MVDNCSPFFILCSTSVAVNCCCAITFSPPQFRSRFGTCTFSAGHILDGCLLQVESDLHLLHRQLLRQLILHHLLHLADHVADPPLIQAGSSATTGEPAAATGESAATWESRQAADRRKWEPSTDAASATEAAAKNAAQPTRTEDAPEPSAAKRIKTTADWRKTTQQATKASEQTSQPPSAASTGCPAEVTQHRTDFAQFRAAHQAPDRGVDQRIG